MRISTGHAYSSRGNPCLPRPLVTPLLYVDIRSLWWSAINSFEGGQLEIRVTGRSGEFGARASSRVFQLFQRVSRFAPQRALIITGSQSWVGTSEKKTERGENEREKRKLSAKKMKKRGKEKVLTCSLSLSFVSFVPTTWEPGTSECPTCGKPRERTEHWQRQGVIRLLRVFLRG